MTDLLTLAREIGSRGITVNCVAPGFIATDMTAATAKAGAARPPAAHLSRQGRRFSAIRREF